MGSVATAIIAYVCLVSEVVLVILLAWEDQNGLAMGKEGVWMMVHASAKRDTQVVIVPSNVWVVIACLVQIMERVIPR